MKFVIDTREVQALARGIQGFSGRRMESAIAQAINDTARAVRADWAAQLGQKLDRPTALTQRAAINTRADVGRLRADVLLRDTATASRGAVPADYLAPQEFGGQRGTKKFERALQSSGAMQRGHKVVPGQYAARDGFGNISRGQIVAVLNQVGGALSAGYRQVIGRTAAKRAASAQRGGRVYVALPRDAGRLKAGVYERKGKAMLPVFIFTPNATYRRRLDLLKSAAEIVARQIGPRLEQAVQQRWQSLMARGGAR